MPTIPVLGALLILASVAYMAAAAIYRGRMSDPHRNPGDTTDVTLEPSQRGLRLLGVKANWPGIALFALGVALLLLPLLVGEPPQAQ
jgi:hypothetical protein